MNLAQLLNSFEKKLTLLSNAEKLQLFFIPILLGFFVVYNFVDFKKETSLQTVHVLEKNTVEYYKFLNDLEQFTQQHSMTIVNIKQNGMKFNLHIEGSFSDIMALILFCESYQSVNAINSFKLSSNESTVHLFLDFEFATHKLSPKNYEATRVYLSTLDSPFNHQMTNKNNENLTLSAIVNKEVLINNTWLKKGELILGFTVSNIFVHHVVLEDKNQQERILYLRKE